MEVKVTETTYDEGTPEPARQASPLIKALAWLPVFFLLLAYLVFGIMLLLGGIWRVLAWNYLPLVIPAMAVLTLLLVLVVALVRRRWSRLATLTSLVALVGLLPLVQFIQPLAYPASLENSLPAATVRLPADAPLKVAWGGDRIQNNYHALSPDQRWAYDFLVEPYNNGSQDLEDYGCYGVTVVAPAAGIVVIAHDGEPEMVPGTVSNNFTAPTGNHVAIQLESGTYLLIAHLKQGSLQVQEGEQVQEGQPIGECGNSGNTSEPHIHIHHQRQDPREFPLNFAEGLPLFFRDHDGPAMPEGGFEEIDGVLILTGPTVQHQAP